MAEILFLAHRIPYPPDKGDKIRSWNILANLAKRHTVYLGCFVDDPADMVHVPFLKDLCEDVLALPLAARPAKVRSLAWGFRSGQALSLGYYWDIRMRRWVDRVIGEGAMAATYLYSSPMGQYITSRRKQMGRIVMDFVDVDSDKWRQYAESKRWPVSWVYNREQRTLLEFERKIAATVDRSLFVSNKEAELFRTLAPESAHKIGHLNNGVDFDYFSPEHGFASPFEANEKAIVFTGAMDYWANVDAVDWFARSIFPAVHTADPNARFYIVGGKPTAAVTALAQMPGVVVTGRVPDVRPYVAHASAVVCPLRIARGIQNKVLEGMAMAKPVIATPEAFEGIDATPGQDLIVTADAAAMTKTVLDSLKGAIDPEIGRRARSRVVDLYSWKNSLHSLEHDLGIEE